MRSGRLNERVPHPLLDALDAMGKERRIKSRSRHIIQLLLKEHMAVIAENMSRAIANADLDVQDKCIEVIVNCPTRSSDLIQLLLVDYEHLKKTGK